jgi:protein O-GlcNAc transferase
MCRASLEQWRLRADTFVPSQGDLHSWHQCLAASDLDVLVFLDLGTNAAMQALATRRYAPVQCTTWAYPVTSGLRTIDYFLSSDLMEPEQNFARKFYSEILVRLPGMACSFQPDETAIKDALVTRTMPRDAPARFVCAQTHYKLLPDHDALFASILANNPESILVLSHGGNALASAALKSRLAPILSNNGINPEQRLEVHERIPFLRYLEVLAQADVMLDTLQFSGCLTSLDALSMDIPIVTLPGQTMRSRQTAAMLELLELPELIARDTSDYIRIANELGCNADWRSSIRERISARKHRLYAYDESLRGLEGFLHSVQPPM